MASSFESLLNPNEIRLNLEASSLEEELTRFNELFELLLANSRETDLDEAVKVARWKILAGEPARKKLRECQWEPGEKMTIESMTAKLVKGLSRSERLGSIFLSRKEFWRRECKPGEGFSAWLADLGAMLTRCSYEKPDEVLRDKIVCFHPDDELSAQLVVLDKDVSLDTVIAKCRSHKLAHKHRAEEQLVSIDRLTPKLNDNKNEPRPSTSSDKQQSHGLFQKPSSTPNKRKSVDAVQQDKPWEAKKNRRSEGPDELVLRAQSLIQIPATKPVMTNPRNAYLRACRRQRRQAARKQKAIAIDAEKVKLESAVGLKDGAESTPAAAAEDEEATGSMLGDGLLVHGASPSRDAADEEVTAPARGVLASHSQVRIVDINRLLEKEAQKKDVGVVAKTACDITVGAVTTTAAAADKIDIKVNVVSTMDQDNANVNGKKEVNGVQIGTSARKSRRRKRAIAYYRECRRKRRELAAILKELEDHPFALGDIGKRAESTLSDLDGQQQKSPDADREKTSAPARGADGPQQESINRLQQQKEAEMDLDVKVNMPIVNGKIQEKVHDVQPPADGSNPVKKEASAGSSEPSSLPSI